MNQADNPSTRRLRTFVVASNLGVFGTAGLAFSGWFSNFAGFVFALFAQVSMGFAGLLLTLANLFHFGARQGEHLALWNSLALGALLLLGVGVVKAIGSYGPAGHVVLVIVTTMSVLVRVYPQLMLLAPRPDAGGAVA